MFMFTTIAHAQNVVKLSRRLMNVWNRRDIDIDIDIDIDKYIDIDIDINVM